MKRFTQLILTLLVTTFMSGSALATINFSDNFDSYNDPDNAPIGGNWKWFLTGWNDWSTCSDFWFGFGPNPAPNANGPYTASNIVPAGAGKALNVFSDYGNQDLQNNGCAEVSVFQEFPITAADAGDYSFGFVGLGGDVLGADVRVNAFIKILDPANGFATVYYDTVDTTASGDRSMSVTLGAGNDGMLLQFGFANFSALNLPSARQYDDVSFAPAAVLPPIPPPGGEGGDPLGVPVPFWAYLIIAGLLAFVGGSRLRARKDS